MTMRPSKRGGGHWATLLLSGFFREERIFFKRGSFCARILSVFFSLPLFSPRLLIQQQLAHPLPSSFFLRVRLIRGPCCLCQCHASYFLNESQSFLPGFLLNPFFLLPSLGIQRGQTEQVPHGGSSVRAAPRVLDGCHVGQHSLHLLCRQGRADHDGHAASARGKHRHHPR